MGRSQPTLAADTMIKAMLTTLFAAKTPHYYENPLTLTFC